MTLAEQSMFAGVGGGVPGKLNAAAVPFVPQASKGGHEGMGDGNGNGNGRWGRRHNDRPRHNQHLQGAQAAAVAFNNRTRHAMTRVENDLRMMREIGMRRRMRMRAEIDSLGMALMQLTDKVELMANAHAAKRMADLAPPAATSTPPVSLSRMALTSSSSVTNDTTTTTVSLASPDKSMLSSSAASVPRDSLERDLNLIHDADEGRGGEPFLQFTSGHLSDPLDDGDDEGPDLSILLGSDRLLEDDE